MPTLVGASGGKVAYDLSAGGPAARGPFAIDHLSIDHDLNGPLVLRVEFRAGARCPKGFWLRLAGETPVFARFAYTGTIRDRHTFSAVQWHLGESPNLAGDVPLLDLQGPLLQKAAA